MTIDRAELFRLAWVMARHDLWSLRLPASRLHGLFPAALKRAWATVKCQAAYRAQRLAVFTAGRPADEIRADILTLECKGRLRGPDWQRLDALRAELFGR
ncbi:hypothetical protein [Paenirhodobacter enshiensis]|uniref:Uncharacterized protein n=1 Tax=Paenirhodobacter enshiensis TaxID=1105367 RepID=A0A086XSA1_9RHOB|nr:hypothetical protein [Paenirhodobacter enshiensis]KFI24901.1 hypothetical protein CG50_07495 [Paenirhodobacter enshiensis]